MTEAAVPPPPDRATQVSAWLRAHGPKTALEVAFNFVGPFLIYSLTRKHLGDVKGLLCASAPPIAWSLIEFARRRRVDALSILVLSGIALSLIAFFGGGSAKFLQLRENLVTGIVGLAFLVSAAIKKPLIYQLARATMERRSPGGSAELVALRDNPGFRRTMTVLTVVWGFGLIAQMTIACVLVMTLSIHDYLLVSPIVGYGFLGALTLFTWRYARHRRRLGQLRREAEAAAAAAAAKGGAP